MEMKISQPIFGILVKVSKSQKQIMASWILPKNEWDFHTFSFDKNELAKIYNETGICDDSCKFEKMF